jgi:hypothetical protein
MGSRSFLRDLPTAHEPALAPERELSQLAALRQATPLGRFSARANIRAAVWDKPRSDCKVGVSRFMESAHGLKKPCIGTMNRNEPGRRPALRFMERLRSRVFHCPATVLARILEPMRFQD